MPLVNEWFHEHSSQAYPVKVRVSYQKLLKMYVLNLLHHRSPKNLKKKSLFKVRACGGSPSPPLQLQHQIVHRLCKILFLPTEFCFRSP